MSPRARVVGGVLALVCLAPGIALRAEGPQGGASSERVSREVMALLMSGPGMTSGNFELRVGAVPDGFPADLLPPGTTIEASAIAAGATTVVGANPSLVLSDLFMQVPRMTAAGWSNVGPPMRGFMNRPAGMGLSLCRNQEFAQVTFTPREAGGVYARVTIRNEPRQTCGSRPDFNFPDVTIPVLVAPADATVVGGGGGGGSLDEMHSRSRIETASPLRAVMAHYVAQIERAGWTESGRATQGNEMAVTRFRTTSRLGDEVTAVLLITRLGTGRQLDLLLSIARNEPSRGRSAGPGGVQGGVQGPTPGGVLIRQQ